MGKLRDHLIKFEGKLIAMKDLIIKPIIIKKDPDPIPVPKPVVPRQEEK